VRDAASGRLLDGLGIPHTVVPDLAHVVAAVRPSTSRGRGDTLVQLNAQAVDAHGLETWARALHAALPAAPVRILLAGLAPAHDSAEAAVELRRLLLAHGPNRPVTVSEARGVWDRIDEIAGAGMWLGSSLHGRIVAAAYGVPRISFAKPKVDAYAADWDSGMPYAVTPDLLPTAVARILGSDGQPATSAARAAADNIQRLLKRLDAPTDGSALAATRARHRHEEVDALRLHALALEAQLRHKDAAIAKLRGR
jgi:hypothetical protein